MFFEDNDASVQVFLPRDENYAGSPSAKPAARRNHGRFRYVSHRCRPNAQDGLIYCLNRRLSNAR
jgi:hypothetical protein